MTDFFVLGFFYSLLALSIVMFIWARAPVGSGLRGFIEQWLWFGLQCAIGGGVIWAVISGAEYFGITPSSIGWQWKAVGFAAMALSVILALYATAAVVFWLERRNSKPRGIKPFTSEATDEEDATRNAEGSRSTRAQKLTGWRWK